MVGRIRFDWAGVECTAELSDDLVWTCDHPEHGPLIASSLGALHDPRDDLGPSAGSPGVRAFLMAAEWLEAKIEGLTEPTGDRDVLY